MLIHDLFIKNLPSITEEPVPHVCSNNILNINILNELYDYFPANDAPGWFGHPSVKMFMGGNREMWPDIGKNVFNTLQSEQFCSLLSNKFNTPKLYPTTIGGGYQTSEFGSSLSMHIDPLIINNKYRWLNLHIYLNKNYNNFYGGDLVLMNTDTHNKISIAPEFGTIIIYKSGVNSLHGHPAKWLGRVGRRGISVYYFSEYQMDDLSNSKIKIHNLTDIHIERLTQTIRTDDDLNVFKSYNI